MAPPQEKPTQPGVSTDEGQPGPSQPGITDPGPPSQPGVSTDPGNQAPSQPGPSQPGVTDPGKPGPSQPGVTTDDPGGTPPKSGLPHPEPLPDIALTSPDGWRVVPQALRNNQFAFENAAYRWKSLQQSLLDLRLSELDLGIIGSVEGIVGDYNRALETIDGKAKAGEQSLIDTGNALRTVADVYERQDQAYYESFGYIAGQLGQPTPPR
ncbi:hypothetical protein [Amycolatopsis sp. 195334CR]|uniref:hypothetical protein n=1 Tax=Amycolatopsis sp. 195334CR TaxID=2814588 RepID=UPI001A8F7540|nr:hypothetical protein [Amycolatopsis sp. 195334CR]MBN6034026.1 hypothetical protein [Amycolatopsis sp. 195334CR]